MHIAIDLGAESGRVIAGDLTTFDVIHRFPTPLLRVRHLYWDAAALYAEILAGCRAAFTRYGKRIVSIGIDSWGVDYALLDASGDMLGNPFHYRDARSDGIMESVRAMLGDMRIYGATGIQFLPFNTIYQLREEVENRSARLAAARSFLTIPDLLNYWLCGVKANEFSNATTTQLYNPLARDWAWDLIDELNIPRQLFGRVVPSGTVLGSLNDDIRRAVGAPSGVKVIAPACHDTGSAVAALPLPETAAHTGGGSIGGGGSENSTYAYLSSGTWSLLGRESDEVLINEAALAANFTNEGGADGGFRFLKNIMGLWILQECRREWADGGLPDYGSIVSAAKETADAAAEGNRMLRPSLIDVDDPRFLKPGEPGNGMVQRVQEFCRETAQQPPQNMGETALVIMESLAKCYAENLDILAELTGSRAKTLYIIGGGCRNELLCQLTANETGITNSAGPAEATALGNLLMQSLTCGEISSIAEGRALIRKHHPPQNYNPQN